MLRGNVPTRLQKLKDGQYDGIILAAAGLKRLHLEQEDGLFYEYFSKEDFYRRRTGHFSRGNLQGQLKRSHGLFK